MPPQSNLVDEIAVLINEAKDLPTLLQQIAVKVRGFLAVDRIKIYQFAADESGAVVAEAIDQQRLPSLLGLHFPATDIPPEARRELCHSPHGTLIDVASKCKIRCQGLLAHTGHVLQPTSGVETFEPVDPCHLQYLLNMGVLTSLTMPILQKQAMWGLLVAHHSSSKRFSDTQLATLELITKEITLCIAQKTLQQAAQRQQVEEAFLQRVETVFHGYQPHWTPSSPPVVDRLTPLLNEMLTLFRADGSAVYFAPSLVLEQPRVYSQGCATEQLAALVDYMPWQILLQGQVSSPRSLDQVPPDAPTMPQIVTQMYERDDLAADETIHNALAIAQVGALLIIPIHSHQHWLGSIVLLRQERQLEKLWAGRQRDDDRNTLPRQSFAAWCEHQHTTPPWQAADYQLGQKVGHHFYIALVRQHLAHLIDYQAAHDGLTQLPNADFFRGQLVLAINQAITTGELLATIMIDLNHFKRVNNALGVMAGDYLLKEVAQRLQSGLQARSLTDAILSRWHGDCFILLLPNVVDSQSVKQHCQWLLERLQDRFIVCGETVQLTGNAGITFAPYDGDTYELIIQHTELALNEAKKQGIAACVTYDADMSRHTLSPRLALESALSHALERHELQLHYQPQVNVETGEIWGFEGLLRWHSPEHGQVSPAVFIPMAENLGLIRQLGFWVFRTACTQVVAWQRQTNLSCRISVNLSPHQLRDPDLCQHFERILAETGARPQDLGLEITESTVMDDYEAAVFTLGKLRAMGFEIAIDDFGTGYSSLSVLRTLPIDTFKIAQQFLQGILSSAKDAALYQVIVSLGTSLDLTILAEGVETQAEWDFVKSAGVHIVQGYFSGKPMMAGLVPGWLQQQRRRSQLSTGLDSAPIVLPKPEAEATAALSLVTHLTAEPTYPNLEQAIQQGLMEYHQIQDLMQQQTEREHLVLEIANKIRQSLDLGYILETLVTEVRQVLGCDRLFLFQFDEHWAGEVTVESVSDPVYSILGEWIDEPCFRNEYVKLYRQGRVRAIDDITQVGLHACHLHMLQQYQVKSNLVLPILYQDDLWGLMIAHQCDAVRHWQSSEITLMKEIAVQAAIAIHQGEMYQELQAANASLEQLAHLDGLTQIPNRRKFDEHLAHEWRRALRSHQSLSLILCDIDHFKQYNDSYGHQAGDYCLQQVAQTLSQLVQRPSDLVTRYGGEEFAIVLPDTTAEGALHLAQKLQAHVRALSLPHQHSALGVVTISLGVATLLPQAGQSPNQLIEAADQALYQAKAAGRDRCCVQTASPV
ncbi:diguanylate cyclase domain-containing protein [Leptolyngbya iicbica]